MLPSKGYFKSLNCPCFEAGYCDRPYCLFRHNVRCSEGNRNDNILFRNTDGNDFVKDKFNTTGQNIEYKPTPISELNKFPIINNDIDKDIASKYCFESKIFQFCFNDGFTTLDNERELGAHKYEACGSIFEEGLNGEECALDTHDIAMPLNDIEHERDSKSDTKISDEIRTQPNIVANSIQENNKTESTKTEGSGLKINNKRKNKNKIKESKNKTRLVPIGSCSSSKCDASVKSKGIVSTFGKRDSNQKRMCNTEPECEKCKKRKSKTKKSKQLSTSKEFIKNEIIIISSEDEKNDNLNNQTDVKSKQSIVDKTNKTQNTSSKLDTKLVVNITDSTSTKVCETKLSFKLSDSKSQYHFVDETLILDNRVERKRKIRTSTGMVVREQKARDKIKMMTPVRLLMQAKEKKKKKFNNTTILPHHNSTTVKIRSVPNVNQILQEKERLLKLIANKNLHE